MLLADKFYSLDHSWRVLILFCAGLFLTPQVVALTVALVDVLIFQGNLLPSTAAEIDTVLLPWYIKITLAIASLYIGLVLVKRYAKRKESA